MAACVVPLRRVPVLRTPLRLDCSQPPPSGSLPLSISKDAARLRSSQSGGHIPLLP